MNDRIRVARLVLSLDAVLGILVVGAACLFGVSYNRHASVLATFVTIFVPLSVLWSSLCYGAYRGLTSDKVVLQFVFWLVVVCNVPSFPIGTGIAGVLIWLWRDSRKQGIRPDGQRGALPPA